MKGSVLAAARWWQNRLDIPRQQKGDFSARLKEKADTTLRKFNSCHLTTSPKVSGIIASAAESAGIQESKIPHGIEMEIYPNKVIVTHNGGRKEVIYED